MDDNDVLWQCYGGSSMAAAAMCMSGHAGSARQEKLIEGVAGMVHRSWEGCMPCHQRYAVLGAEEW